MLTLEDCAPLQGKIERVEELYDLGFRLMTLIWNSENELGYPNSTDKSVMEKGLKPFGLQVLSEMNRLGIVVDVSHLSDGGFWDALKHSTKPVVASHSNARAVCNHPRNLTDNMIRALSEKGGVMGLNFAPQFLNEKESGNVKKMIEHIRHIYQVGGLDVMAIGSDFDGFPGKQEIKGCQRMNILTEALDKAGFSESQIEAIMYKNALRVFNEVFVK